MKTKSSRFDRLVACYYPAVYSLAARLTDDPRDAVALRHVKHSIARASNCIAYTIKRRSRQCWYLQFCVSD